MQGVISTLINFLGLIQMPAWAFCAVMLCMAGYNFFAGGQEGREKGKRNITWLLVGLVIVLGAGALRDSLRGVVAF
ncbi:hypothetical protein E2L07_18220 [Halalkalibacterium halodurans]|uniref:hypothetical protein n=1 Tax=Halalkalibacterium halodurans TaxID=86665 RepID=UPI001067BEF8|nr:hypothetical protein [Halalkalibacterium halodurans]TES48803.1 hypothetical protein E2L07_18220 [Halalkalibacterium halodurans]